MVEWSDLLGSVTVVVQVRNQAYVYIITLNSYHTEGKYKSLKNEFYTIFYLLALLLSNYMITLCKQSLFSNLYYLIPLCSMYIVPMHKHL